MPPFPFASGAAVSDEFAKLICRQRSKRPHCNTRRVRHRVSGMSGKRILIVGGGAAGLAAAYDLKTAGVFGNGS